DDHELFFSATRPDSPGTVFRWEGAGKAPTAIAQASSPKESRVRDVPEPTLVEYPTFDGKKTPAWLYLPRLPEGRAARGLPFVLTIHGGPEGQERPGYSAERAYLLSLGFGVLAPNVRGSTGYGRAYRDADDGKKRYDSVRDAKAAVDWL